MATTQSKAKKKAKKQEKKGKKGKKGSQKPALSKEELRQRKRQRDKQIKAFVQFATPIFALSAVIGIVALAVTKELKFAIAGAGGIAVLALSYKYPRSALWAFLAYMPFSGTVTYWIGGGNFLFQLAKDGFYFPALVALYQQCKRENKPILIDKRLQVPLFFLLVCCALTTLFVNVPLQLSGQKHPVLQAVLGFKIVMGYMPLAFCAYHLVRTKKEAVFATRMHVVLAIACCFLGVVQYQFLSSGRCKGTDHLTGDDLFKAHIEAKCLVGGALLFSPSQSTIRLPSTFVSPWHWAWFLISNAFFTFAGAFSDPSVLVWRPISMAGMGLVLVNAFISGQRIALALVPVVNALLLVLTGQLANLKRFLPIGIGLGVLISILSATNQDFIQERIESFQSRAAASPPQDFIEEQFGWALRKQKGVFGRGLGRATNSARVLGWTALVETFYSKMIFEMGVIGTLAFVSVTTVLTVICFRAYRSLKDPNLRTMGASFWVFVFCISYNLYWYPLDTDPVAVYYWFFAGWLLKLPEIDKQEAEKRRLQEEAEEAKATDMATV